MRIKWQWRFPLVLKRKRCLFTNYSRLNKSIHISGLHMEWRRGADNQLLIHSFVRVVWLSLVVPEWGSQGGVISTFCNFHLKFYLRHFHYWRMPAPALCPGYVIWYLLLVFRVVGIVILYFPVHFPPMTCTSLLVLVSCVVFVFNQSNDLTRFQFLSGSRTRLLRVHVCVCLWVIGGGVNVLSVCSQSLKTNRARNFD